MSYLQYVITTSGGTLNTYLDNSYVIISPSPVTLTAGFAIVPTTPIPYGTIKIRWNASVNLGGFPLTIGGISVNQDQVNQTGTFELMYDGTSYYLQYFPDFTQKPQETFGVTTVTVPAGGGTLTISPGADTKTYVLQGTTTLTSNYTVTGSTSGVTDGSAVRVVVAGGITTGSNTVTIFGQSISKYDCLTGGVEVYAEFNSATSSYVATYVNKDTPLGKLSTTGLVSGDNGKLVTYDFASNAFVASFLSQSNFPTSLKTVNVTTTTISSAQILNCFTSPITLVPASGSASVVEMPLAFIVKYIPGGTPYATNVDAVFEFSALSPASQKLAAKDSLFSYTIAGYDMVLVDNYNLSGSPERLLAPNYAITLRSASGNPTAGNGTLIVYTVSVTLNL